jgi:PHD/YefM family antitoxin component YafN of YafNO toxin-antitoxin module
MIIGFAGVQEPLVITHNGGEEAVGDNTQRWR